MTIEPQTPPQRASARVPELDLLRFAAACAVMLYHYTYRPTIDGDVVEGLFGVVPEATRFGYLGVTLFFMISGFVILWSSEKRSAGEFVVSRLARLFPSFWIAVVLTALAVNVSGSGEPISTRTFIANLTMMPGALGVPYVDGVYWTLFVELKFYALVYIVLLTRTMRWVEAWLALWLVLSLASLAGVAPVGVPSLAVHPYGPYFISGCLFYLIRARGPSAARAGALVVSCALGAWYAVVQQLEFMSTATAASNVVAAMAVVLFHTMFGVIVSKPGILKPSRRWYWLGSLTYPLYLMHNQIGKIVWHALTPDVPAWIALAVVIVFVLLLATVVAAMVERRACGVLQKRLLVVAVRFGIVRPTRAAT